MKRFQPWQSRRFLVIVPLLWMLMYLSACGSAAATSPICACALPSPVWQAQSNQATTSGASDVFALKMIDITTEQFRFYYVFKAAHPSSLHVSASSSLSTKTTPLTTTVQLLGQIGVYQVGVIHVKRTSHAGQVISLAITPVSLSGTPGSTWRISPLRQLRAEPPRQLGGVAIIPTGLPEAHWYGPVMQQLVSYVKVVIPGQRVADRTYVFVRSDDPVVVSVITKAQYLAIAGAKNFTP